jgi:hypothetical protein
MARAFSLAAIVVALLAFFAPAAEAHLMPAGQGTLNVVGNAVFSVLSVPVSALHDFDDDGDGLLSLKELEKHHRALHDEIDRRFVVSDGDREGSTVRVDLVLSPRDEGPYDRAGEVVALKHTTFAEPPADVFLKCDLFGARDAGQQLTITATRKLTSAEERESATFTRLSTEHRFFRPLLPALADSLRRAAAHRQLGTQHLLILLTLIGLALGWRFRLRFVTSLPL